MAGIEGAPPPPPPPTTVTLQVVSLDSVRLRRSAIIS